MDIAIALDSSFLAGVFPNPFRALRPPRDLPSVRKGGPALDRAARGQGALRVLEALEGGRGLRREGRLGHAAEGDPAGIGVWHVQGSPHVQDHQGNGM